MELTIAGKTLPGPHGLTVCSVVHDEMYFLPEFLRHYRALGADRFLFLDDASGDGTADFLAAQPDCMVLRSSARYFDRIGGERAIYAWRKAMLDRFCDRQWAVVADADEFVVPPPGLNLPDVAASLQRRGASAVWGVMLDVYPRDIADLFRAGPFRLDDAWFFDARRHMIARPGRKKPVTLYRGSRARLMGAAGLIPPGAGRLKRALVQLGLGAHVKVNVIHKAPLVRWDAGHRFVGSHQIEPFPATADILPILHFKFTPDLGRKIDYALETGGYVDGSRQYDALAALIARMRARGSGFLGRRSQPVGDGAALYASAAAVWSDR